MTTRICLHGPESTGKSTLATRLAAHYGCEGHGTDIGMAELVHIAETQDAMNRAAAARDGERVLFDTDPLITAVWAEMMFETRDAYFDAFTGYADLYLLLDIDLPFVDDGLRVYAGTEDRRHFFALCKAELDHCGVRYALIRGTGDIRFSAALDAIAAHC